MSKGELVRYIDSSPAQEIGHENAYQAPSPEICENCGIDATEHEGWCRCIGEQMDEAAARDAQFCFGPDPFPTTKENA